MGLCGFNSTAPLDLVTIEFRVRSSSSSAFMFAPKPDPVRLESNASAWKSYDMQLQYFSGNQHGAFSHYLSITASLNLLISLFPWKSSQTMQVLIKGKREVFDKRCLKCLSEFLQKLTSF